MLLTVVARSRATAALAVVLSVGCYSSTTIPAKGLVALHDGGKDGEVLVHDKDGQTVKLDPNSEIRFVRTDGTTTDWFTVRDLHVNDDGIFTLHDGPDGKPVIEDGVPWDAIVSAEVKNLDHGTTAVAVVAGTAVVIGLVAVLAASKGNLGGFGNGLARGTVHVARVATHVKWNGGGSGGSGAGGSSSVAPSGFATAETEEPDGRLRADDARPLFGDAARRRSIVRVVGAFDGGRDLSALARNQAGVTGLVRLFNFIELGGGLRWLGSIPGRETTHTDLLGFARVGIHAEIDARRRFAFPFSIDLGGGRDVGFYSRLNFGLRVRLDEDWALGLYAFNPTYTRYKAGSGLLDTPRWSFPSGIEATFVF